MIPFVVIAAVAAIAFFGFKPRLRTTGVGATAGTPAACHACGNFIANVAARDAIARCSECGAYGQIDEHQTLVPVPLEYVARMATFETYLPEAPRWPQVCCLCCGAATRTEKMTITYAADPGLEERMTANALVTVASVGTMRVAEHVINVTERYAVPHCDQHDGGAYLVPAGIAFKSFRYFRQFVEANRAAIG